MTSHPNKENLKGKTPFLCRVHHMKFATLYKVTVLFSVSDCSEIESFSVNITEMFFAVIILL